MHPSSTRSAHVGRQAHDPHDRHQPDLPAVVAARSDGWTTRPGQSPAGPAEPLPRRCRDRARHRAGVSGLLVENVRRPERAAVSARRVPGRAELPEARVRRRAAARTCTAAASTRSGSAPSCIRACWPSTRPRARSAPSTACTSNTPLQALVLLNDPIYVEAARVFAQNILANGGASVESQLDWAFERALGRAADGRGAAVLSELYRSSLARFAADAGSARGARRAPARRRCARPPTPGELAAWPRSRARS